MLYEVLIAGNTSVMEVSVYKWPSPTRPFLGSYHCQARTGERIKATARLLAVVWHHVDMFFLLSCLPPSLPASFHPSSHHSQTTHPTESWALDRLQEEEGGRVSWDAATCLPLPARGQQPVSRASGPGAELA